MGKMNSQELKAEMVRKGYTIPILAEKIGISKKAFYCKLKGKSDFRLDEIKKIIDILELNHDKILFIFFENSAS